jgi:hypothetical protein
MAQWLYRRIFRGIGIVFVAGLLTALFLFLYAQSSGKETRTVTPTADTGSRR